MQIADWGNENVVGSGACREEACGGRSPQGWGGQGTAVGRLRLRVRLPFRHPSQAHP